jgi:hypothetical protein
MPKLLRGAGVAGIAVAGYRLWQRLPRSRQKQLLAQLRKHGPKVAKTAFKVARARKGRQV